MKLYSAWAQEVTNAVVAAAVKASGSMERVHIQGVNQVAKPQTEELDRLIVTLSVRPPEE